MNVHLPFCCLQNHRDQTDTPVCELNQRQKWCIGTERMGPPPRWHRVQLSVNPPYSTWHRYPPTFRSAEWVEPLLKRYGVQLYLAGHDHDLEHLRARDGAGQRELLHHVVTGAGSQTRGLAGAADSLFQHDQSGAHLFAPSRLTCCAHTASCRTCCL